MSGISKKQTGFTIVELLIVIVVIGILAAITIVAYNGIQNRARDTQRRSDIAQIKKALQAYNVVHGGVVYVPSYGNYTAEGSYGGWDVSTKPSWLSFMREEHGNMPVDPTNIATSVTNGLAAGSYLYAYYCYNADNSSSIGHPDSAGVTLHYRVQSGTVFSEKFLVDSCLTTIP